MYNPIGYMLDNKQIIIDTYNQNSSPKQAWESLCKSLPDIESNMDFNTFKEYFRIFALIVQKIETRKNHIAGWSIAQGKDGYYRGTRRFQGRMQSVYLGKKYDREAFTEKIGKKEESLNCC
ncbi:MAG: hypothetical protein D3920_00805 [Candidatus Electrothrix sp. AW2]|nr:hypothetical protein [Candidatus Electrothrix gigas]